MIVPRGTAFACWGDIGSHRVLEEGLAGYGLGVFGGNSGRAL